MPTSSPRAVRPWYHHTLTTFPGLSALAFVIGLLVLTIIAPHMWEAQAAAVDPSQARLSPSTSHIFGTDELGRDVLLRVLVGTRASLLYAFGAVAISTALGVGFGLLAAVLGHRARQVMYQITATATAFPSILLAVLLATLFGRSGSAAMAGLAIAGAPQIARLTMNLTTSAAGSDSASAARVIGVRGPRLAFRHIFPQVAEPLATLTIMSAGSYLLAMSALSFVGLGVQAPDWDWGYMMSGALSNMYSAPTAIIGPGVAIVLTGVSLNVLGESLASGIDPRNRVGRATGGVADPMEAVVTAETIVHESPQPRGVAREALSIENLTVTSQGSSSGGRVLLDGVSLRIGQGERVAIVGESGSGKSLALAALACLTPSGVESTDSSHRFFGDELRDLSADRVRRLLSERLAMVFQDPMATLNPALTIGSIMGDKLPPAERRPRSDMKSRLVSALEEVGIADAAEKLKRRPHELSGGQRQRVMIALALLGDTKVLLADEPTTALDVSVQAQIARLLVEVSRSREISLVLVSHDLALVSEMCDRILVMYRGRIVEDGTTEQVLTEPRHPYTRYLLASVPTNSDSQPSADSVQRVDASNGGAA